MTWVLVLFAGGLGALCRWGLGAIVQSTVGVRLGFPVGTFVVNVVGCLLFGLTVAVLEARSEWSPQARVVLLTGFMGAFTTFSSFAFDAASLLERGRFVAAMVNVVGQNSLGLAALLVGVRVGRLLV